jgi:hypothetical protein
MLKIAAAAAALVLGASALATAQTSTTPSPSSSSPPAQAAPSSGSSTAGSGSTTMSESDIKKRLEQQGYSDVKLKDDASSSAKGDWSGTAKKGGKEVSIQVDASGKVTEK